MRKNLAIALILLFISIHSSVPAAACGNEEMDMLDDARWKGLPLGRNLDSLKKFYTSKLEPLKSQWLRTKNISYYSDYGLTLMYVGRYQEAEAVFLEIEKKDPGRYSTAANLGTTYELMGKNELALKWIKKGVEINPSSHDSSEWLHVKILEVKIKGDQYNTSQYLLGTDFGKEDGPKSSLSPAELEIIRFSIVYQLDERMTFLKPKDKIVALLLFELGNIYILRGELSNAESAYRMAKEYGYGGELLEKRYEIASGKQIATTETKPKSKSSMVVWIGAGVCFLGMVVVLAKKRKRK